MLSSSLFFYLYDTKNVFSLQADFFFNNYNIAEKHEKNTELCSCGEATSGDMSECLLLCLKLQAYADHF